MYTAAREHVKAATREHTLDHATYLRCIPGVRQ